MKRLLGEFEKQDSMVVLMPYRADIWRNNAVPAQDMIVELVNAISKYQKCILGVHPDIFNFIKNKYTFNENVELLSIKYNDSWARDSIASVLVDENNNKSVNAFDFNAYGAPLYLPFDDDRRLNKTLFGSYYKYDCVAVPLTLEWGNVMPDGEGTIFVVENTIVNSNRNPNMKKSEIEKILLEATCSKKVVWVPFGLEDDETGGHIDNVLSFADRKTILLSFTDDKNNVHYERTHKLYDFLSSCTNANGEKYTIIKLPVPNIHVRQDKESQDIVIDKDSFARNEGDNVLYTYVNFSLINGAVILPKFNLEEDQLARSIIEKAFADREIVQLDAREAFLGGGGFHCLTKHIN